MWKEAGNFLEYLGVGLLGCMVQVCVQAKGIIGDTGLLPTSLQPPTATVEQPCGLAVAASLQVEVANNLGGPDTSKP